VSNLANPVRVGGYDTSEMPGAWRCLATTPMSRTGFRCRLADHRCQRSTIACASAEEMATTPRTHTTSPCRAPRLLMERDEACSCTTSATRRTRCSWTYQAPVLIGYRNGGRHRIYLAARGTAWWYCHTAQPAIHRRVDATPGATFALEAATDLSALNPWTPLLTTNVSAMPFRLRGFDVKLSSKRRSSTGPPAVICADRSTASRCARAQRWQP